MYKEGIVIKSAFRDFCGHNPHLSIEQSVEYFSILGGIEDSLELDYFETVFDMVRSNFVEHYRKYESLLSPSYLLESPYQNVLVAAARGDGKYYTVLKKAKLSESAGEKIIDELIGLGVLRIEYSREIPLKSYPKQKLKKELRRYRIQDKLRFVDPFIRFWFGFVAPYRKELIQKKSERFLENFGNHYERLRTLVYEQLCDALLVQHYEKRTPLIAHGSYWDQHTEFDILAVTESKQTILGECKYKERKICKSELTKLKAKALQSGIRVDTYALFSKSGFSNELHTLQDESLLLYDLGHLQALLNA